MAKRVALEPWEESELRRADNLANAKPEVIVVRQAWDRAQDRRDRAVETLVDVILANREVQAEPAESERVVGAGLRRAVRDGVKEAMNAVVDAVLAEREECARWDQVFDAAWKCEYDKLKRHKKERSATKGPQFTLP